MSGSMNDGSSFMDALTDPRLDALLGMTQGFAQAAMPTRMPTPFGAVLGMGAGGLLQGAKAGQQLALGGQQLQQAKIGNQRAGMLLDAYKQMYGGSGAPFGMPSGGGSPGSAPTGDASGYLTSPQQLKMLGDLAMATGQDRSAATLYGMPNTMAGGAGYAMGANGRAFPTPGGAADPAQAARLKAAEAYGTKTAEAPFAPPISVDVPDGNGGTVTKQIPVSDWAGMHGAGGAAAPAASPQAASIPALQSIPSYPARMMAINAALKAGLPPAAWAPWISTIHTESGWNPNVPDGAAGEIGMGQVKPATGQMVGFTPQQLRDPATNLTASAKYFGQQWQAGGGDPTKAFTGYNAGDVNGKAGPDYVTKGVGRLAQWGYPGMAPGGYGGKVTLGPQQEAALKVQTARAMPYDLRPGGMHIDPTGNTEVKNPELREIVNDDGTKSLVHVNPASPFAPPGTTGTAAPVMGGGAAPVGNAVPYDVQEGRNKLVEDLHGKDADSFVAANNTQGWLNQIDHAAEVINKAGAAYQTGPYAETRLHLLGNMNDAARMLNIKAPFNESAIASAEELRKATTTAGFELSSHYEGHARQAAATIMNATSAVPGISNSPQGIVLVSHGINEGAQSAIDMHNYNIARTQGADQYGIASNPGTRGGQALESAEADFVKAFPASMYSSRAISTVQPVKVEAKDLSDLQGQFSKYLPGTVLLVNGAKQTMVPPRPTAPPIPTYMHGYLQPQGGANAP